jgi:hypothetical protein
MYPTASQKNTGRIMSSNFWTECSSFKRCSRPRGKETVDITDITVLLSVKTNISHRAIQSFMWILCIPEGKSLLPPSKYGLWSDYFPKRIIMNGEEWNKKQL